MVNSNSFLLFFRALFSSFFSSIALETQTSNIQSILVNAISFSLLEKLGNLQVRRVTLVKNNNLLQGVTSGLFCFKDWALNKLKRRFPSPGADTSADVGLTKLKEGLLQIH